MPAKQDDIARIRLRIDELNDSIRKLINERAACALEIATVKREQDANAEFYRPEREAQVLRSVLERNEGPLGNEEMARLFREIMSACLALEQPLKVAFLGPEGTFTQAAALKHFGHSVNTEPLTTINQVFREVESGAADYGVVPIENSTEGVVNHTLDMFLQSRLNICGEVELRIHHHLMSKEDGLGAIQRVYSHQQSLAQCREWLDTHLAGVERVAVNSNAEAARRASNEQGVAAIAGEAAADIYKLTALRKNIEDEPNNTTRFLVVGEPIVPPSGRDKTSLLMYSHNKPGSLFSLLEPIARHGIDMTRIESRPFNLLDTIAGDAFDTSQIETRLTAGANWDYVFFIDMEGHRDDEAIRPVLAELQGGSDLFKVLGSYPRAVL